MDSSKIRIHILFFGADYFGDMASTQRIKNLINPLLNYSNIRISNLVFNSSTRTSKTTFGAIRYNNICYTYFNPFSILYFFYKSFSTLYKFRLRKSDNFFYCYGYPEIENICTLFFAKMLKYKIIFDIVENENYSKLNKSSIRHQFKVYTLLKMQRLIPKLGSLCFGISFHLISYLKGICKGAIPIVYLPISVDIDYIQKFEKSTRPSDTIKLFYGGSFGHKDGIPDLIKAFEIACGRVFNLELILTGKLSKEMDSEFLNLLNKSPAKNRINYLGCVPIDDYYRILVDCDILCMVRNNSAYANAGFPFKLGEYLASGNSIIATRVSDISYYLTNDMNAILIDPDSVNQICDAILRLAQDIDLRKKISSNSLTIARQYFDSKVVSNILYKAIQTI